jgi:hypothetical protein
MPAESIITYLKPNFPAKGVSGGSYETRLEYIGPHATMEAASPEVGDTWGLYEGLVETVSLVPISGTSPLQAELVVTMSRSFESSGGGAGTGTATEITYEIEWATVQRPLKEHPAFRAGSYYELYPSDHEAIAKWEDEKTASNRGALSSNAERYAKGIDLGIQTYDDFAPVAIKTTTYVNGPPATSTAGAKEAPAGFPNLPTGYEWVKSADRSLKAGKKNKWERSEQWMGALKVLVDKNTLYY